MLQNLKKRNDRGQEGFTIIEVLIVLAIAGLILLIVFLAVPALQRSSRNTQRKNDAAAIGGAVANFISNNGGQLPNSVSDTATNTAQFSIGTAGNVELAKMGFYTTTGTKALAAAAGQDGNVYISAAASPAVAATPTGTGTETATKVSTNTIAVIYGQDCTPTANSRTAAIYYVVETGTGVGSLQCTEQ
jgi:prepilin-type N-terminal cleavage/methylation domain-containing protein